ncbi:MAG: hypothetical protein AAF202_11635, partial [Pseudomonadota bacterium]
FSENSVTGVYVCTPRHVEAGECTDVDDEYYKSLASSLGPYEIGYLWVNGEKTLAYRGFLSPGSGENLIRILEASPEVKTLVLASLGGSEQEAWQVAEYVAKRALRTWVPSKRYCLSACTQIFLSGVEPRLDGVLGVHTGQFLIQDPYQIRNVEAANQLIERAAYEMRDYFLKTVRLYLKLEIPLDLLEAANLARGQFLVFTDMQNLKKFAFHESDHGPIVFEEVKELAISQTVIGFDFESYEVLF